MAGPVSLGRLLLAVTIVYVVGVVTGLIKVPLPSPSWRGELKELPSDFAMKYPAEGPFEPNTLLKNATRIFQGKIHGSESVVVAPNGSVVMLDKYGMLHQAHPSQDGFTLQQPPLAYVGPGRPLGSHFDADGNLIICDSLKGLTMYEMDTGRLVLLASSVSADSPMDPNTYINYANDVDIASDGSIYFSDSQSTTPQFNRRKGFYDTLQGYLHNYYSADVSGRLLKYDPKSRKTTVLVTGIFYANGVALTPDESFVAVVETSRNRVLRYWLKGEKAGSVDVMIRLLPCFPDGISTSTDGNFWLACVAPMTNLSKLLVNKGLRSLLVWLNAFHINIPLPKAGIFFKLQPDGEVIKMVMDPDGSHVAHVSAVTEHQGRLYLGNLVGDFVSYIDISATGPDYPWAANATAVAAEAAREAPGESTVTSPAARSLETPDAAGIAAGGVALGAEAARNTAEGEKSEL